MTDADVIIIGSGMGGATMAAALAPSGRRILILERGEHLRPSEHDRDDTAIFINGHYRPDEEWLDGEGTPFNPGNYYYVGGNSKFYGAVLIRYRREDFSPLSHMGGTTPGWPISYDDLEPFYCQAERLFEVRGQIGEDPTEPLHSAPYPHAPVPDEPAIADLRARLSSVGLHPASLHLGSISTDGSRGHRPRGTRSRTPIWARWTPRARRSARPSGMRMSRCAPALWSGGFWPVRTGASPGSR